MPKCHDAVSRNIRIVTILLRPCNSLRGIMPVMDCIYKYSSRNNPARVAFTKVITTLRRFFMRVTCRGDSGRQARAQDISDYRRKSGSNVLATTPQPAGYPDSLNLLGAMLKKVRACVNSASCTLCLSVRLVRNSTSLYTGMGLV